MTRHNHKQFFDDDCPVHFENKGNWLALCGTGWIQATAQENLVTCEKCKKVLRDRKMNLNEIKNRIRNEGHHIRVQTELGTAVKISKRQTYIFLDTLQRRGVAPAVEFTEIMPGKSLVTISAGK